MSVSGKCEICDVGIKVGYICEFYNVACRCGTGIKQVVRAKYTGMSSDGKLHMFKLMKNVNCPICGAVRDEGSIVCNDRNDGGVGEELAQELFSIMAIGKEMENDK